MTLKIEPHQKFLMTNKIDNLYDLFFLAIKKREYNLNLGYL